MAINLRLEIKKLQYNNNRKAATISALSSGKIDNISMKKDDLLIKVE